MNTAAIRALLARTGRRAAPLTAALAVLALPLLLVPLGCGGGGGSDDTGSGTTGSTGGTPGRNVGPDELQGGPPTAQPGWTQVRPAPQLQKKKWTFLVYMNGANDLERYGSLNMNQMEKVGSTAEVNLVVQFKRANGVVAPADDDRGNGDWVGTRRYYVTKDGDEAVVNSPILSTDSDADMGSAQTLKEFVEWGTRNYPADRYAIVLWNHGAGWRSRAAAQKVVTRGFSYDEETQNHINTIELPGALNFGRKWDLVIWDSSLMQMLEVAYEIRNNADWIVGSEESPPGTGYVYDLFLVPLASNPDLAPRDFGSLIVDTTIQSYTKDGPNFSNNVTQSMLEASKVASVAAAVNELGAVLKRKKDVHGANIASARDDAESYNYPENKDLIHMMQLLREYVDDAEVDAAAQKVEDAARAAIIREGNGRDHPDSNGIAIYGPTPFRYSRDEVTQANGFGQRYGALTFSKDYPNWQSFLAEGPR